MRLVTPLGKNIQHFKGGRSSVTLLRQLRLLQQLRLQLRQLQLRLPRQLRLRLRQLHPGCKNTNQKVTTRVGVTTNI